jgi:lipopolysaccharide assembly protein A
MSRAVKLGLILIIFLFGLALHLKNDQIIGFHYYAGSIDMPFSFFLVLALITGAILGILACLPLILALKRENARLSRQTALAEREINNLRVIPVRDLT